MITKNKIFQALSAGKIVGVGVWTFSGTYMNCCEDQCCENQYDSIEEAADAVVYYSRKEDLSDVIID